MKDKIFLLVNNKEFFEESLKRANLKGIFFESEKDLLNKIYISPPEILVIDLNYPFITPFQDIIKALRKVEYLLSVPILVISEKEKITELDFGSIQIDDFLMYPLDEKVFVKMIELIRERSKRTIDVNPLTRLPGNTTIISKIQVLIEEKKDFALGYVDLNHFKAYNDRYGFSRGDEVIRMLSRVLVNSVDQIPGERFVGHIGVDDFVFIVEPKYAEEVAKRIIYFFDEIIPSFYDEEDRKRGKIISKDRQGNIKEFPIMTVSIAIVLSTSRYRFSHYGEVSKVAAELKEFIKMNSRERSAYIIDRRSYRRKEDEYK